LDDDETGKWYKKSEIKTCPDGYITHKDDECPPETKPPLCKPCGGELCPDVAYPQNQNYRYVMKIHHQESYAETRAICHLLTII